MTAAPLPRSDMQPEQRPRLVNHDTFDLLRVSVDRRPDLAEKFRVEEVPTICVIEGRKLRRSIPAPRGCRELERELEPWLR